MTNYEKSRCRKLHSRGFSNRHIAQLVHLTIPEVHEALWKKPPRKARKPHKYVKYWKEKELGLRDRVVRLEGWLDGYGKPLVIPEETESRIRLPRNRKRSVCRVRNP